MSRLPPLNSLKAFEAAGRHLNFRIASEELGVSQGAVAQQVRALEAFLDKQLFIRLPRGLELTGEGRSYLASINRAFDVMREATESLVPEKVSINISVTPTFASKWLISRLGRLSAEQPNLDLRIVTSEKLANFQSDGIDIAVRLGKLPFGPNLNISELYPLEYFPVCSPDFLQKNDPISTPQDLNNHLLLHDAHGLWPLYMEQNHANYQAARAINFGQTSLALEAAIAGQGIALGCLPLVEEDLKAGRLVRILGDCPPIKTEAGYYIVAPSKPKRPAQVALLRDWLLSVR